MTIALQWVVCGMLNEHNLVFFNQNILLHTNRSTQQSNTLLNKIGADFKIPI